MDKSLPLEDLRYNACRRAAVVLRGTWQDGVAFHTRIFDVLIKDWMVMAGVSENVGKTGHSGRWREHVVPCKVILENCIRMFEDGKDEDEVAAQIVRHLHIVRITKEERHKLDFVENLKTRMPPDWRFGVDDPFARLHQARIVWVKPDEPSLPG